MSFCSCAGSREGGRESGGDCHMGWTRSVSRKLFQWKILGLHCLHTGTDKCENFSISHVNAHTETCIGELWSIWDPKWRSARKTLALHYFCIPCWVLSLTLCASVVFCHLSMHTCTHGTSLCTHTHSCPQMLNVLPWPGLVIWRMGMWQSPDPWSLQSKSSTFPTPSPSYRVYPILLCYPTPPTHPHSHEKALKQRHSLQGKHWGLLSTKTG